MLKFEKSNIFVHFSPQKVQRRQPRHFVISLTIRIFLGKNWAKIRQTTGENVFLSIKCLLPVFGKKAPFPKTPAHT